MKATVSVGLFTKKQTHDCVQTDLEEAAEVMQGALGPQETPSENGTDLLAHGIEMGDESVGHLSHRGEVSQVTLDLIQFIKKT